MSFTTIPVLIADTFGDPDYLNPKQWELIPHLKDKVSFYREEMTPNTKPHPHGWMCFSKYWPVTLNPKVAEKCEFHLVRWIDSVGNFPQTYILDLAKDLIKKHGCLVWSNSWGVDRGSQFDPIFKSWWEPWSKEVNDLVKLNPYTFVTFSAGNDGPNESGWPQSLLNNCFLIGANNRAGNLSEWSSWTKKLFGVAGGEGVAVADPFGAGYTFASGTSFSGPAFSSLALWYLAEYGGDRNDFKVFMANAAKLPPQITHPPSPYWGFGDLEPWYQELAKEYTAWETLKYPGKFRQLVARITAFNDDLTLPSPRIPGAIEPILPK